METLNPILNVTETIKQLEKDFERKNENFKRYVAKDSLSFRKNRKISPAIKRNFKFYRYFCKQSIKYLKDYRDLLLRIHEKKESLLKEMEEEKNGRRVVKNI